MAERLIRIGWSQNLLAADGQVQLLKSAGLAGYISAGSHRLDEPVEILVPESQMEAAKALLHIEPDAEPPAELEEEPVPVSSSAPARCPECHSFDTRKLPPYAGWALMGSAAFFAVMAALGRAVIGVSAFMIGFFAVAWLDRHTGHYRCRSCNREWRP